MPGHFIEFTQPTERQVACRECGTGFDPQESKHKELCFGCRIKREQAIIELIKKYRRTWESL